MVADTNLDRAGRAAGSGKWLEHRTKKASRGDRGWSRIYRLLSYIPFSCPSFPWVSLSGGGVVCLVPSYPALMLSGERHHSDRFESHVATASTAPMPQFRSLLLLLLLLL
ncbi:unnamed protein product [Ectocarpus sp. 8 AP-2014]